MSIQRKRPFICEPYHDGGFFPAGDSTAPAQRTSEQPTPCTFVFSSDPNAGKKIRKPYEIRRREEVAFVRRSGACSNCRQHKKSVGAHHSSPKILDSQGRKMLTPRILVLDRLALSTMRCENHLNDSMRPALHQGELCFIGFLRAL